MKEKLKRILVVWVAQWLVKQMQLGRHYDIVLFQTLKDWLDEERLANADPEYSGQCIRQASLRAR